MNMENDRSGNVKCDGGVVSSMDEMKPKDADGYEDCGGENKNNVAPQESAQLESLASAKVATVPGVVAICNDEVIDSVQYVDKKKKDDLAPISSPTIAIDNEIVPPPGPDDPLLFAGGQSKHEPVVGGSGEPDLVHAQLVQESDAVLEIDEDQLLQQRLQQELTHPSTTNSGSSAVPAGADAANVGFLSVEEQIRQRILNREAVTALHVQALDDDAKKNAGRDEEHQKKRKRNETLVIIGLSIILFVAIGLGVGFSQRNKDELIGGDSSSIDDDSASSTGITRRDYLMDLLVSMYENEADGGGGSGNDPVNYFLMLIEDDQDSPHRMAFEWMTITDEYCYDVDGDMYYNYDTDECDYGHFRDRPIGIGKEMFHQALIERYVVTLFYFSTNQHPNGGWYDGLNFLNTTTSVCEWHQDITYFLPPATESQEVYNPVDGVTIVDAINSTANITVDEEVASSGNNDLDVDLLNTLTSGIWCQKQDTKGFVQMIVISQNDLMGTLPFEVSWLSELEDLNVNSNYLHGTIPNQLGHKLKNLRLLQLFDNEMTGTLPLWLFGTDSDPSGGNYVTKNLELVLLGYNLFTGTIPTSRTIYSHIRRLQFGTNLVSGTIPAELFDISSSPDDFDLFGVSFADNLLTGAIPTTIGKLRGLNFIDFNENQLSGSIPSEIGLLEELEWLFLRGNQLSGTIPSELGMLGRVDYFYLHKNLLTGTIPVEVFNGEMGRKVQWFVLSENKLTGSLPEQALMGLRNVNLFSLDHNRLTGTIPSTLRYMTSLDWLYVQNNSFTGDLDPLLCNETTGIDDFFLDVTADCGGQDPELVCSCCNECCNDVTGCPFDTGVEACEAKRQVAGPLINFCECFEVDSDELVYDNEEGGDGIPYRLSCNLLPFCQFCNNDMSKCALRTNGWYFDGAGDLESQWIRYEYISSQYMGRNVLYKKDASDSVCEVSVDGELCSSCTTIFCLDGFETIEVKCENVMDGAFFSGCNPVSAGLDFFGVLQVLHPQYDTDQCQTYNPGHCEFVISLVEDQIFDETYKTTCECSESGLDVACQHDGCVFCLFDKDGDDNSTSLEYCFLNGLHLLIQDGDDDIIGEVRDYLFIPTQTPVVSDMTNVTGINSTDPSSVGGSANSSVTYNETTLLSLHLDNVDNSCVVEVDRQRCATCNRTLCNNDGTQILKYQIDCSNILGDDGKFDNCNNETGTGILRVLTEALPECIPYDVTSSPFNDWNKKDVRGAN